MGYTLGPKVYDGEKYSLGGIYGQKRAAEEEAERRRKEGYRVRLFHHLSTFTWVVYYRR